MKHLSLLLALGALLAGATAFAKVPASSPQQRVAVAKQLYDEGAAAFAAGRYPEAAAKFQAAYAADPRPDLIYDIAIAQEKAKQRDSAIASYERYCELTPKSVTAENARTAIERLKAEGAAVTPKAGDTAAPQVELQPITPKNFHAPPESLVQAPSTVAEKPTPTWKKGWVWGVVAGSIAAVALGVGLGVGLGTRTSETTWPLHRAGQ